MASIIGTLTTTVAAGAVAGLTTLIAIGDAMLAAATGGGFAAAMFVAACGRIKLN